jgi:hypothetical protein
MPADLQARIADERILQRIYYFLVPSSRRKSTRRLRRKCIRQQQHQKNNVRPPSYRKFLAEFKRDLSHLKGKSWVKITCGTARSFQGVMEHAHVKELREWMRGSPEFLVDIPTGGTQTHRLPCSDIIWHETTNPVKVELKSEHCEQDIEAFLFKLHEALSRD